MDNIDLLSICLDGVVVKFQHGASQLWTHKTYLSLSEKILQETSINISPSSLKRIFGKVEYEYFPQKHTRDALAIYIGYTHWDDFAQKQERSKNLKLRTWSLVCLGVVVVVAAFIFIPKITKRALHFESLSTQGIAPLFVSFKYELPLFFNENYSVDFDDFSNKEIYNLSAKDTILNNTFTHADIYHVHLINRGKIVKTVPIIATNTKWETLIGFYDKDGKPNYENLFATEQITKNGAINVSPKLVARYGLDTTNTYWSKHRFITDIGITDSAFVFESRFRNVSAKNNYDCPGINFSLLGLDSRIKMHFASYGCIVSDVPVFEFGETIFDSRNTDMSQFEVDLDHWQHLRVEVFSKRVTVLVNEEVIYKIQLEKNIGKLFGTIIDIKGCGEIDFVRYSSRDGKVGFVDEFDN